MNIELFNDNFQNYKVYHIPAKAQLVIADIPYNLGSNAYGSSREWYIGGDNKNGESKKAGKSFFKTDGNFNIAEFFHFSSKLLKKEPKERGKAPAMIIFCSYQQIPFVTVKDFSAQVLKANMKIVGAVEIALVLYREKLPKFNNDGQMIVNWFHWRRDGSEIPRIHPTQKPVNLLRRLIEIFTDVGDVVIDPCAGSGSTLRACAETNRNCYGFEIDKKFYTAAKYQMLKNTAIYLF